MSVVRPLLLVLPALLAAGCSCNSEQDLVFPKLEAEDPSDAPTDFGSWLSFDTAPDGQRLTMAYYDRDRGAVGYAVGNVGADASVTWVHERVDGYPASNGLDPGDRGRYASQRTAPDGTVWVAFRDDGNHSLRVSHRTGPATWEESVVVDPGAGGDPDAGHWASLQLGADGQPVVAHCDGGSTAVRLSRFDGSAWSTVELYKSSSVDWIDDQGVTQTRPAGVSHTAMLAAGGKEYVAFYDSAAGTLNLLEGTGTTFTHSVVDDDGDVGQWPSLWTDGSTLRIAYQDVANQDLKLATRNAGNWSVEVVDDGEMRGADTALFEIDGQPAIVYFDGMDNDSWLAKQAGGGWQIERIGKDDGAVGFHNEVVQVGGLWFAGSYDFTAGTLFLKSL